jgi:REP element-mobilizing transposase RayT
MSYYERNLPHWHPEGKPVFLTWRLSGSLPRSTLAQVASLHANPRGQFLAAERSLDRALSGPRWLAQPEIASLVVKALQRGEELKRFALHSWVVMPNHVHVLLEPAGSVRAITKGIKGITAKEANAILGRIGKAFWQDESFDRWVRNSAEFERVRLYIENNPVKARLARRPEEWHWSSAHRENSEIG